MWLLLPKLCNKNENLRPTQSSETDHSPVCLHYTNKQNRVFVIASACFIHETVIRTSDGYSNRTSMRVFSGELVLKSHLLSCIERRLCSLCQQYTNISVSSWGGPPNNHIIAIYAYLQGIPTRRRVISSWLYHGIVLNEMRLGWVDEAVVNLHIYIYNCICT